ncbi:hypothetical protein [Pseudomonas sp. RIT-To-2]|uniref:hypothetical protein n=1 Tax=Pseudomonas sp. RIT-To-2 TaxID=3462541 RepID=UPI002413C978
MNAATTGIKIAEGAPARKQNFPSCTTSLMIFAREVFTWLPSRAAQAIPGALGVTASKINSSPNLCTPAAVHGAKPELAPSESVAQISHAMMMAMPDLTRIRAAST